jgi:hypothetical protein
MLPLSFVFPTLPDRNSRSASEHSCGNVHGLKLLEQQLGRIWDVDLCNLGLVLARPAFEGLLGEVPV